MNFIERWLSVSPDAGNGTSEIVCIVLSSATLLWALRRSGLKSVGRARLSVLWPNMKVSKPRIFGSEFRLFQAARRS